ncbi:hypothetical protein D3C87_1827570 [compost metagenome]
MIFPLYGNHIPPAAHTYQILLQDSLVFGHYSFNLPLQPVLSHSQAFPDPFQPLAGVVVNGP